MLVRSIIVVKIALAFTVLAFVIKLAADLFNLPARFEYKRGNSTYSFGLSEDAFGQQIPVKISMPKVFNADTLITIKNDRETRVVHQNAEADLILPKVFKLKKKEVGRLGDSIVSRNITYLKVDKPFPDGKSFVIYEGKDEGFNDKLKVYGPHQVEGMVYVHSNSWKQNVILSLNNYLGLASNLLITFFLLRILQSIKRKETFAISSIQNLRYMGIILFIEPFVGTAILIAQSKIIPSIEFNDTSGNFPHIYMNLGSDFSFSALFTGMLLILLAQVFDMGYKLQKEQELTI